MTQHAIRSTFIPLEDAAPMRTEMGGSDDDIPVIALGDWPASVEVHLGNHPDPAAWLRESAAALLDLADQVDAAAVAS